MSPTVTRLQSISTPPANATRLATTAPNRLGLISLVVAFITIYMLTLDTGLQPYELHGGDLITHQYAQVHARPGNAPGYPIYTMGGWLWFHGWHSLLHFFGQSYPNPLPILSSYSTLWAILALGLFYAILSHLLGKRRQPWLDVLFCLLLATFYGVTYFFWYYATTTEQYSSAVAQTLAILYLYLLWDEDPARRSLLYWLAFLCGLSFAHMLTVAFIVPPLVTVILWRDPSLLRNARAILVSIVAASLPLLSYIYVYLRGALHPEWWGRGDWTTPQQWFWSFVSTAQGRDELAWAFEPGRPIFGNGFPEGVWYELSLPLILLGLIGLARLPRRQAIVFYATLIIYAIFCWLYRFGNWFQVVLPAYPLILVGLAPLYMWMTSTSTISARVARLLALVALVVSIIWRVDQSWPGTNSRHRPEDSALEHAAILLDQPLPTNAQLFAAVDDALALNYLVEIWGIRPDLNLVSSRDANATLARGGRVYSTVDATATLMDELAAPPTLDGLSADWIELAPNTSIRAESAITVTPLYTITPNLLLSSFSTYPAPTGNPRSLPTEPGIDVRLTWHLPTGIWPQELAISLRPTFQGTPLVDPSTTQPIQQDRPRPLYGLWPDSPIERSLENPIVVHDTYRLFLPSSLPYPADGLLLILYTQTDTGFINIAEISLPLTAN